MSNMNGNHYFNAHTKQRRRPVAVRTGAQTHTTYRMREGERERSVCVCVCERERERKRE